MDQRLQAICYHSSRHHIAGHRHCGCRDHDSVTKKDFDDHRAQRHTGIHRGTGYNRSAGTPRLPTHGICRCAGPGGACWEPGERLCQLLSIGRGAGLRLQRWPPRSASARAVLTSVSTPTSEVVWPVGLSGGWDRGWRGAMLRPPGGHDAAAKMLAGKPFKGRRRSRKMISSEAAMDNSRDAADTADAAL